MLEPRLQQSPRLSSGLQVRLGSFHGTVFAHVVYDITGSPLVELQPHNSQFAIVYFVHNHLWSTPAASPGELCGYAPANLVARLSASAVTHQCHSSPRPGLTDAGLGMVPQSPPAAPLLSEFAFGGTFTKTAGSRAEMRFSE